MLNRNRANVLPTVARAGTSMLSVLTPALSETSAATCSPESSQSPSPFQSIQAFKAPCRDAVTCTLAGWP